MHEFQQLEDAVIAALEPLKAQGLKTLAPYSGELEAEDIIGLTRLFPCVYVLAGGMSVSGEGNNSRVQIELTAFVGDRNVRGPAAAAREGTTGLGVYGVLEAARECLHGRKMLPGWLPMMLGEEAPLVYAPKQGVCIYTATYKTRNLTRL